MKRITLPAPDRSGGKPLMACINSRATYRNFSSEALSLSDLSDFVWGMWGINRPESGRRTVASARNWQETQLYVTSADGTYLYNPEEHALDLYMEEDLRAYCGRQPYVPTAPVIFIFVANQNKETEITADKMMEYSNFHAGALSEAAYLLASSKGMHTLVIGMVDRALLAEKMNLEKGCLVTFTQPVGYPPR